MQLQSSNLAIEEKPAEIAPAKAVQDWLIAKLAEQLSLDAKTIDVAQPLTRYGLDSIDAVTMVGDLEDLLDMELPSTLFWDHPTIEKSANYLAENFDISNTLSNFDTQTTENQIKDNETLTANESKGWGKFWKR